MSKFKSPSPEQNYRCKKCGDTVIPKTHHKMESCTCGKLMVDRGWYGSRVLWDGRYEDIVEEIPSNDDFSDDDASKERV